MTTAVSFVRACVARDGRAPAGPVPSGEVRDSVVAVARAHGVVPYVYLALRDRPGVDAEALAALEARYRRGLRFHLQAVGDAAVAVGALAAAEVPALLIKGPVLAEDVYPRPDLRPYADLDLLVPAARFGTAVEALEAAGARMIDRNWRVIRAEMRGQLHMALRYRTPADVHWHLVNRKFVRDSFSIPMDAILARARPFQLDGTETATLDPEDTLLQLVLHAGLAGGQRLSWLKDVDQVIRAGRHDWDEAVRRARAYGAGQLAAIVLARTAGILATPVPAGVLADLGVGRPWPRLVAAGERRAPLPADPAELPLAAVLTRATRRRALRSALTFARRLRNELGVARPRELAQAFAGGNGGRPGDDMLIAEGDECDRAAYLAAVAAAAHATPTHGA